MRYEDRNPQHGGCPGQKSGKNLPVVLDHRNGEHVFRRWKSSDCIYPVLWAGLRPRTEHKGNPSPPGNDDTAGSALPGPCRRLRFTRPCGAWPCGFSVMWPPCRVRAVPCLHLSRAGRDARVRFAAAVTRSLLPVCRDFPVVHPLRFRGLTLQLPPAVCVRLRLPLRPVHPRLIARLLWRHGTARCRGICEQRRNTSCNMRNLSL